MKRVNLILIACIMVVGLFAVHTGTPKIMMAEIGNDMAAAQEQDAQDGIAATNAIYSPVFWLSTQYFQGEYGNDDTEAMIDFYEMTELPTAVFNGMDMIVGGGDTVADGSEYSLMVEDARYDASPITISIDQFDVASGDIAVTVTMLSDTYEIMDGTLRMILVEEGLPSMQHVTRQILAQDVNLSGQSATETFTDAFTIDGSWVSTNLYAIAYVQEADHSILQAASTFDIPSDAYRIGVPFDFDVVGPGYNGEQYEFESEKFYLKNYGSDASFTAAIENISAPQDWMIMFCHTFEDGAGGCHPSNAGAWEFELGAGESVAFDFLIPNINSNGLADFNFVIQSSHAEPEVLHFTYETGNPTDDDSIPFTGVVLDQNTPNPFNPETTIRFSFPTDNPGNTELVIYNIKGQQVKRFNRLAISQGEGVVTWNGKDNHGNDVTSGVYYYRLEGETSSPARKMLLLK